MEIRANSPDPRRIDVRPAAVEPAAADAGRARTQSESPESIERALAARKLQARRSDQVEEQPSQVPTDRYEEGGEPTDRIQTARIQTQRIQTQRLQEVRIDGARAEEARSGEANPAAPDEVRVSPAAERLSRISERLESVRPQPVSAQRLAELRSAYREGQLNTIELINKSADRLLDSEATRAAESLQG